MQECAIPALVHAAVGQEAPQEAVTQLEELLQPPNRGATVPFNILV